MKLFWFGRKELYGKTGNKFSLKSTTYSLHYKITESKIQYKEIVFLTKTLTTVNEISFLKDR